MGCRPEAWWASVEDDVEASRLVARLPWGSEAGGMMERGKGKKKRDGRGRGGERGRSLSREENCWRSPGLELMRRGVCRKELGVRE